MSLQASLDDVRDKFVANAPDAVKKPILASVEGLIGTFDRSKIIKEGDKFPEFALSDATGKEVTLQSLLANGAFLLTFYRGGWCPFCNLALGALAKHQAAFAAKGVTLVGISPELPDTSLTTAEKNELKFSVLSDAGNGLARKLGLVWKQPDSLRPVLEKFGNNLPGRNGDNSFEVPIPTNVFVDKEGFVKKVFVDPDYKKRLEPATALQWADEL